jgi:hypothetical protein
VIAPSPRARHSEVRIMGLSDMTLGHLFFISRFTDPPTPFFCSFGEKVIVQFNPFFYYRQPNSSSIIKKQ